MEIPESQDLFRFEFSPVLSERNLVCTFFSLKSSNFNTITNLILSNWSGKLLTIGAPLKWGLETIYEGFDQYHLGKINH